MPPLPCFTLRYYSREAAFVSCASLIPEQLLLVFWAVEMSFTSCEKEL